MDVFQVSVAANAKFDIREDEEQYQKLIEILELLISAGYYRAKIQGLSSFDKIVGGMVWCISLCAQSVDVDLLYSENSTIGQKIALTEQIVKVLPKLKCPHSLEPHQIQGLDCIHILPVMQWLVKEAIEAKIKHGDEIQNYSVYQFRQEGWKVEGEPEKIPLESGQNLKTVQPKPRRIFKRSDNMRPLDIAEDVKSTLLEYGLETSDVVVRPQFDEDDEKKNKEVAKEILKDLKIAEKIKSELKDVGETGKRQRIPAKTVAQMLDTSTLENLASNLSQDSEIYGKDDLESELERLRSKLSELEYEEKLLENEHIEEEARYNHLMDESKHFNHQITTRKEALEKADPILIETITKLLQEHDEIKQGESSYKKECKKEIEALDKEIELLEQNENGDISHLNNELDAEKGAALQELENLRSQLADLNQEIFRFQSQVDSVPSQIELTQYQKRFVELYNQMSSKHRETKRHYTLHNTLLDVRNFIKREIDLLNNIDDQKNLALKDSYKESFVDNLYKILKSVEDSLEKILSKKKELQHNKDKLADDLQVLIDKQRLYNKTVVDFQMECHKNEQLRSQLEGQEDQSP
uniref:Coiled-coil domain-containing protein 93 n=1 Tax=Acrobeloides nanus TaxID=290746 RepID=A0A914CLQ7_9BILA